MGFAIKIIPNNLKIYFIDVGQGDSTLIVTPNRKTMLIDGGGSREKESFDIGEKVLLPYLLDRGITKLDYVLITHFDSDHVGRDTYNIAKYKSRESNYLLARWKFRKLWRIQKNSKREKDKSDSCTKRR